MADSTSLEAEIDVLMEEMKDWEQGMAYEWSETDRSKYLERKKDHMKNFFMNEVAAAERKASGDSQPTSSYAAADDAKAIAEAKREEEEAKRALEKALRAESEAVRLEKEAEDAAMEAEVRRQLEAEDAQRAAQATRAAAAADQAEAAAERASAERAAAEKVVAEKAAAERAAEKAAAERAAAQKAASEKAATEKSAAERAAANVERAASQAAMPVPKADVDLQSEMDAALEKEMKEAQLRITRNPVGRQADLNDSSVIPTYIRIRNDRDDLNWMILGYPSNDTPNKITVLGCGAGGWAEMIRAIPNDAIYLYINYKFGDTGRSKFVFMTYVPDSLSGMKKSRVLGHRPQVEKLLKYMQMSWHVLELSELSEETLVKKLLAAGGANYSVQEADKGDFTSYKKSTREFYEETEKKTAIGPVVYQSGPLTTTPMDISGRSMVASQSDFRQNLVDLK